MVLTTNNHIHVCHLLDAVEVELSTVLGVCLPDLFGQSVLNLWMQSQLVQQKGHGRRYSIEATKEEQDRLGYQVIIRPHWGIIKGIKYMDVESLAN